MSKVTLFIPLNEIPNEEELLNPEKVKESRNLEPVVEPIHKPKSQVEPKEGQSVTPTGKQVDFVWGWFFFDIPEIYADGNKVYFHGEISKESVNGVKREIMRTGERLREAGAKMGIYDPAQMPIDLIIHSPGGCVKSGFNLIDFMETFPHPINTIGTGMVASMGTLILLAGKKRAVTKNTHILIHQLRTMLAGKRDEILDYIKHIEDIQQQFIKYITSKTKLSAKEVEQLLARESWIPAEEALKMGIVDEVI